VPGENYPDCVVSDGVDDSSSAGFLSQQTKSPSCAALRRRPTDHRHDGRLLSTVQLGRWLGPRIFGQRMLQAGGQVSLRHTRHLARIPADGDRGRPNCLARIEQQEHLNPPPDARSQRRPATSPSLQLEPVFFRQPEAFESRRTLHPMLRSEPDLQRKTFRDRYASDATLEPRPDRRWRGCSGGTPVPRSPRTWR
jgi:hypothetical protein